MVLSRLEIRKQIHNEGHDLYESCPNGSFKWLVGEIMALNEEFVLNNPDLIKTEEILGFGFSVSQAKWIIAILEKHGNTLGD